MAKNINDVFPSRFLKAYDLQGREPVVTIDRVELEQMGRTRETLPVVHFVGKTKGLKLNVTMARELAKIAHSEDMDAWKGVTVQLYATSAEFGKQAFPVIRIKAPVARVVPAVKGRTA